jgi:translocation and assembly module TamB
MDSVNLNLYGQGFSNAANVRIAVNDRTVEVSNFSLKSGTTYVNLTGRAIIGSSLDITIDGSSSLSPLAVLTDRIEDIRGDAEFVFRLYGPWSRPSVTGGIGVSDSSLALKGTPQRLSGISGYMYVYQDRAVIERLSATLGGGTVSMSGIMDMVGFRPERVYVDTTWENVTWTVRKNLSVTLGGALLFRRTEEIQDITGEVLIERGAYRERIEWKSWLLEARRQRVSTEDELPWIKQVGLNVRVRGDENIVVENNVARAGVSVDVIARGTLAAPRFFGRVSFKQGKVFFRNSRFSILSASADYSDEAINDPYVSISAQAAVKGYNVLLNLEGKLEDLDLTLVSYPALDEEQILGLLTYGEFGSGLSGLEGGIGAAEATSFLTGKQQDLIEERLTEITGLDRITIDPYVSSSTGQVAPRMSVSKELLSDRLFVTYATTGEEQELNMEYLLNRNISLLGGRDEHGGVGGDIKFRFTFK